MSVRAKFKVDHIGQNEFGGWQLSLSPVVSGSKENEDFFKYTPAGRLDMMTINEEAAKQFQVGQEFYIDLTPCEAEEEIAHKVTTGGPNIFARPKNPEPAPFA